MCRLAIAVVVVALAGAVWFLWPGVGYQSDVASPSGQVERRPVSLPVGAGDVLDVGIPSDRAPVERIDERSAEDPEEAGIVLEGRVVDPALGAEPESGAPAGGVRVRLISGGLRTLGFEAEDPETVTADDGSFRFVIPDEGKRPIVLDLLAEGDARVREALGQSRIDEGARRASDILLARFAHGTLEGVTVDPEGSPISGVTVVPQDWEGAPEQEEFSDDRGVFRFEDFKGASGWEVRKEGHVLLEASEPSPRPAGGWERFEIVLAPQCVLQVVVSDSEGRPVEDLEVRVEVSPTERFGIKPSGFGPARIASHAETDPTGTAFFPATWANQRLRVAANRQFFERVSGDRLIPEDGADPGSPLVVRPGDVRTVRLVLAGLVKVSGIVLGMDGVAFAEANVQLRSLDVPSSAPEALQLQENSDSAGRFVFDLRGSSPLGRVLISASDLPFASFGRADREQSAAAWTILDLGGRLSGEEEVTLRMQQTLAIGGEVLEPGKGGVSASIRAVPQSDVLRHGILSGLWSRTGKNGRFRLAGLPPGRFDLEVTPDKVLPLTWVRDVEAGTENVTIPIEGRKAVRVSVDVRFADGELVETIVLQGRLHPHQALLGAEVAELPTEAVYSEPFGWPEPALGLWYGSEGHADARGSVQFNSWPLRENPAALELDEGLWWIGAKGRDREGNRCFPIGTGLVRLTAGEYRLRFELRPSVRLAGRVRGIASAEELFVVLAHGDGRLVPLDVRRGELRPLIELGADGSFHLDVVPTGDFELRVGTRDELLNGRSRHAQELQLRRGERRFLEIGR